MSDRSDSGHNRDSGARQAKRLAAALPDRYVFRRALGEGGAAYVILADDVEKGHPVAIKILRPEVATAVGEKRFHREIEIIRGFDHPNILSLLDFGSVGGIVYFTMPFVEGDTLETRIRRERQMTLRDALAIADDVGTALDHAHSHGIIHRDVKPANVLLSDGRAVVADFGIARAMAVEQSERITMSGVALGTPAYMAPEQAGGIRELDKRCDVYSLGCLVYEMLAGEPPFTGPTDQAIIARVRNESARSLCVIRADIPAGVDAAVLKALEKSRAQRFRAAGEFTTALVSASLSNS